MKTIYLLLRYIRYLTYRYLLKRYFSNYSLCNKLKLLQLEDSTAVNFFGYYNVSPSNKRNEVIFCSVNNEQERGRKQENVGINFFKNNQYKIISQSNAWNWQQGCMLQWLPPCYKKIIFNSYNKQKEKYISKVIDENGDLIKAFEMPIYSVSKNGHFSLTLNFKRLTLYRPDYGYFNHSTNALPSDHADGIWYLDLLKGNSSLVINLELLKTLSPCKTMEGSVHKVNHIDINPSSNRIMFLHIWIGPRGRFTRLITCNIDGSNLYILNGDKMTSHCCWLNDLEIISYCYLEGKGNNYFVFKDKTNEVRLLSSKLPSVDGHPSVSPNKKWLVTDTYPDKSRMSYLILFNLETDKIINIGRFFQPLKYQGEIRIDLHPKWSLDGNKIYFESGHQGKRKLYHIDVRSIMNE